MEAEKISVELDSRFHLFRNESEISKESKVAAMSPKNPASRRPALNYC